jgi:hypothetical protein
MPGVGQANPVPTKQPVRSGRVGDNESDWSAPLLPDKSFILEQRCSLYRTTLWQQLTPEQRTELGKHEVASVASTGIWLEIMLMRLLARLAYQGDAVSRRVQYALTELGEECRHTIMFARMIEKLGTPVYGPPPHIRALGNLLPAMATGPSSSPARSWSRTCPTTGSSADRAWPGGAARSFSADEASPGTRARCGPSRS